MRVLKTTPLSLLLFLLLLLTGPVIAQEPRTVEVVFGRNPDIDSATTPEDLWNNGGTYTGHPVPCPSETIEIFSSDPNDTAGGTGAQQLRVRGLDDNFAEIEETIKLNGVTPVASTQNFCRFREAYVSRAGSGGSNAGTITIRNSTTTANVFALMPVGANQDGVGAVTVPSGRTWVLDSYHISLSISGGGSASGVVEVVTREPGAVWRVRRVHQVTNSYPIDEDNGRITLPEKTDIKFKVDSVSSNNTSVSADLHYFVDDRTVVVE